MPLRMMTGAILLLALHGCLARSIVGTDIPAVDETFTCLDADRSGSLSLSELGRLEAESADGSTIGPISSSDLRAADADKNSSYTKDEFRALAARAFKIVVRDCP